MEQGGGEIFRQTWDGPKDLLMIFPTYSSRKELHHVQLTEKAVFPNCTMGVKKFT